MSGTTRRAVAAAGHTGNLAVAELGLESDDPAVRATALGALERLGALTDASLVASLTNDPAVAVRRRAAEIAAAHPDVDLLGALHDDDPAVVEVAAWSCGEHESRRDAIVMRLIELAGACSGCARP